MAETIEKLGKYEIRRVLGKGAMGIVYEGWDPIIARRVAIKTVHVPEGHDDPETEEALARFRREAQAAGRLTHPNIVAVFDYGETGDLAYIVMEYVDGPSVKSLVDKQERFALADTMRVMTDLLTGLQFSHDRGVVHRDIKPANVMLTTEGQGKIADFGIARIESSSMTQAGTVLGTPAYMSPEQFMGQVVDARTDIYSSGVLLYQLLTGERPFEGSMSAIMHKALNTDPPLPSQISVTSPPLFDAVVRKAMAKRPEDRFQSAVAFLEALRNAYAGKASIAETLEDDSAATTQIIKPPAPGPWVSPPAPGPAPSAPVKARSNVPVIVGAAVLALLIAGGGGWLFLSRSGAPLPTQRTAQGPAPAPPAVIGQNAPPVTQPPPQPSNQSTSQVAQSTAPPPSSPASPPPAQVAQVPPSPQPPTPQPPSMVAAPQQPVSPPPAVPSRVEQPEKEQVAIISPDIIRGQLARVIAGQRCAMVDGSVRESGAVTLAGLAGASAADALRQGLSGVTIPGAVDWRVKSVEQTFCPALDVLHPIVPAFASGGSRLGLTLAGGRLRLKDGDRIMPRLVMPDFRANLRVDYVGHDGSIMHMYPQLADPAQQMVADVPRVFAPGEAVNLGVPSPGHPAWEVGEPYGNDMILAIASSLPLFDRQRPGNVEMADSYLRDLQAAVDAARARGAQLTGNAIMLDTLPK